MSSNSADLKINTFDEGLGIFLRRYKYELFASCFLVTLIGVILLAFFLNNRNDSNPETLNADSPIVVEIQGSVVNPGVYEMTSSQRIRDLISMAGGVSDDADQEWVSKNVNQAELLVDGQKVYLPNQDEMKSQNNLGVNSSVQSASIRKVNINSASKAELEGLPGIGPSYAEKIIASRPYKSLSDLLKVKGIGPSIIDKIKDQVVVK